MSDSPRSRDDRRDSAQPRSLRLLIVDDERDTVTTLSAIFVDEGHSVIGLHNPAEVLPQVRSGSFDAIILDIDMPGLSGYTLAREIRQWFGDSGFGDSAPLLVAISGKWLGQTDRMLADLAGFDHFLRKPCDPTELIKLLAPLAMAQAPHGSTTRSDLSLVSAQGDPPASPQKAYHALSLVGDYFRAEIVNRKTAEETKAFLEALAGEISKTACQKALIIVRRSHAIFKVAQYDLAYFLSFMSRWPSARVALHADSPEVRASHKYVEFLARQRGLEVRSFEDEAEAVQWLRGLVGPSADSTRPAAPDEHH